jgi:nitrite reductase/ring-hydroxylating ferredoxin subunit
MSDAAQPSRLLCRLEDVPEGGGKEFWFGADMQRFGVFLLRQGGEIRAYRNSCPHLGTPLNIRPDRFLDIAKEHIICATHGALFRITDGFCLRGPCIGASLETVAIEIRRGAIYLSESAAE